MTGKLWLTRVGVFKTCFSSRVFTEHAPFPIRASRTTLISHTSSIQLFVNIRVELLQINNNKNVSVRIDRDGDVWIFETRERWESPHLTSCWDSPWLTYKWKNLNLIKPPRSGNYIFVKSEHATNIIFKLLINPALEYRFNYY